MSTQTTAYLVEDYDLFRNGNPELVAAWHQVSLHHYPLWCIVLITSSDGNVLTTRLPFPPLPSSLFRHPLNYLFRPFFPPRSHPFHLLCQPGTMPHSLFSTTTRSLRPSTSRYGSRQVQVLVPLLPKTSRKARSSLQRRLSSWQRRFKFGTSGRVYQRKIQLHTSACTRTPEVVVKLPVTTESRAFFPPTGKTPLSLVLLYYWSYYEYLADYLLDSKPPEKKTASSLNVRGLTTSADPIQTAGTDTTRRRICWWSRHGRTSPRGRR